MISWCFSAFDTIFSSSAHPYTNKKILDLDDNFLFVISWCSKKCFIPFDTILFQFRTSLHKQIKILFLKDNFLFMISWCFSAFDTIFSSSTHPYTNNKILNLNDNFFVRDSMMLQKMFHPIWYRFIPVLHILSRSLSDVNQNKEQMLIVEATKTKGGNVTSSPGNGIIQLYCV
jgi:hypothetical protein